VEAQRRYRERLRSGVASKNGSETTYESKKSNANCMRTYRAHKKIATIEAYAKEKIQLNLNQQLKRKFKMWKRKSLSPNSVDL